MDSIRMHACRGLVALTACQLAFAQEEPKYLFGPDEPFTLIGEIGDSGIQAGGWTQFGYTTEGKNNVGTGLFNSRPNEIVLNQQWFYLEKAPAPTDGGWDWGFRFDAMYGTDSQDTQAFGGRPNEWDNDFDNGNDYGWALPQAYVDIANEDLNIRVGHFYTLVGYEVVTAPDNFFYSHAFTMYTAEPFTHTGVLATYSASDTVTVYGGWTAGWDTGFTRNSGSTFLGGVSVQLTPEVAATYILTAGDFGSGANGSDTNGYSHSIVVDVAVSEKLNYVAQSDYVDNQRFVGGEGKVLGLNQYLIYDVDDLWSVGGRVEYLDTNAFGGSLLATTVGVNVHPSANLTIRPELRYEKFSGGIGAQDQLLFAVDAVLTF
ncbi:MAG: outer membrane beta-barrel protein [Planctomycetota bacterium]